jgi:hypothetical protein
LLNPLAHLNTTHHLCEVALSLFFLSEFMPQSNFDAAIEPVEFCRERTGGVAKYEKVVYGEHLIKKVLNNFIK